MKNLCFMRASRAAKQPMGAAALCPFCEITQGNVANRTARVLFQDDKVIAFEDKYPSAYRHYLVVPVEHIKNIHSLEINREHYALVEQMLKVGQTLLQRDAPDAQSYRFGFHRPPFNSVDHLHLHCIALPYKSWWLGIKYASFWCLGGWIEARHVLKHLNHHSQQLLSTTTTSAASADASST